jgi:putative NADPH-quinone reductase
MKIFLVYAHHEQKSFNHAMYQKAISALTDAGHEVKTSDLYGMAFNPVSNRKNFSSVYDPEYLKQQLEEVHATKVNGFSADIEAELLKLEWCDIMIWQFPLWWFGVPAILKGWVDRVFAMGRTYGNGRFYENGTFRKKRALLSLTTGGAPEAYTKGGFNGDLLNMLKPIHRGIMQFTGFSVLAPHVVYGPVRKSPEDRERELEAWGERLVHLCREQTITVGDY